MAANETRAIFVAGLKNAHAMENQALAIMKPQVKRIENYPEVAAKLQQHINETEGQILRLEEVLASLAEDHSALKERLQATRLSRTRSPITPSSISRSLRTNP